MTAGPSLLLVEDDAELASMLTRALSEQGYAVTTAADGQRGLHLGLTQAWELMIVDRGLPAIEGADLVARLRAAGVVVPILVLSARASTQDRVDGLDAGAGDYLAKPFELPELLARLRALVRRDADRAEVLAVPGGAVSVAERRFTGSDGRVVELSERETGLLATLAGRPRQVFSRGDLRTRVFGEAESESVVDTYVHYCRRKLGRSVISTVRGLGYRLGGS